MLKSHHQGSDALEKRLFKLLAENNKLKEESSALAKKNILLLQMNEELKKESFRESKELTGSKPGLKSQSSRESSSQQEVKKLQRLHLDLEEQADQLKSIIEKLRNENEALEGEKADMMMEIEQAAERELTLEEELAKKSNDQEDALNELEGFKTSLRALFPSSNGPSDLNGFLEHIEGKQDDLKTWEQDLKDKERALEKKEKVLDDKSKAIATKEEAIKNAQQSSQSKPSFSTQPIPTFSPQYQATDMDASIGAASVSLQGTLKDQANELASMNQSKASLNNNDSYFQQVKEKLRLQKQQESQELKASNTSQKLRESKEGLSRNSSKQLSQNSNLAPYPDQPAYEQEYSLPERDNSYDRNFKKKIQEENIATRAKIDEANNQLHQRDVEVVEDDDFEDVSALQNLQKQASSNSNQSKARQNNNKWETQDMWEAKQKNLVGSGSNQLEPESRYHALKGLEEEQNDFNHSQRLKRPDIETVRSKEAQNDNRQSKEYFEEEKPKKSKWKFENQEPQREQREDEHEFIPEKESSFNDLIDNPTESPDQASKKAIAFDLFDESIDEKKRMQLIQKLEKNREKPDGKKPHSKKNSNIGEGKSEGQGVGSYKRVVDRSTPKKEPVRGAHGAVKGFPQETEDDGVPTKRLSTQAKHRAQANVSSALSKQNTSYNSYTNAQ